MNAELLLHIHAQPAQHDEAYIVGNRAGLLALRDAIDQALLTGEVTTSSSPDGHQVMTADGEGYTVTVRCDNSAWNSPIWQVALLPYTRDRAQDRREHAVGPWDR